MNFVLYARPHRDQNGRPAQEMIALNAQHPYEYYVPYGYFLPHCGPIAKALSPYRDSSDGGYTEYLVRARRCVAFADASGLRPVEVQSGTSDDLLTELRLGCLLDHTTEWVSTRGTKFILTEPYTALERFPGAIAQGGFSHIMLPESFSPYGGVWNPTPGIAPRSKSYLICPSVHRRELFEIGDRLEATANLMPRWNNLTGVSHV